MSEFYAKTLVAREGAPMGNRNAAGSHRGRYGSVVIAKHETSGGGGTSVLFNRGRGNEKTYRKPTKSSLTRLNKVLGKSVKSGLTFKSSGRHYGGRTAKSAVQFTPNLYR
jgi:hypothetical protein